MKFPGSTPFTWSFSLSICDAMLLILIEKNLNPSLIKRKALVTMFRSQRFLWLVIMHILVLLMNLGNAYNQCVPLDQSVPFCLVQAKLNSSNPCADSLATSDNVEMVKFPGVAALQGVRLAVVSKDYSSGILELCDVGGCLPQLYLRLRNSSIHPFRFESSSSNKNFSVNFFNCSSIGLEFLDNDDYPTQKMQVCPIYVVRSTEGILKKDVTFCTKMVQLDSPLDGHDFRSNKFRFRWSQPKRDVEKFKAKLFKYVLPVSGKNSSLYASPSFFRHLVLGCSLY